MRTLAMTKTYIFLIASLVSSAQNASGEVQSKIDNFELASCSATVKKCIQVKAVKAQSGTVSPSLALKSIVVEMTSDKNKVIKRFQSDNGFYDLEANRIILSKLVNKNTLKETVINMQTLEVKYMEMR